MNELKPCPFCGSGNIAIAKTASWIGEKYKGNIRAVGCADCGVFGGVFNTLVLTDKEAEKMAIESWNRRADNDR